MEEKRDIKKSFLALLLAACMLISMVPVSVFAESGMTLYLSGLTVSVAELKESLNVNENYFRLKSADNPEGTELGNQDFVVLKEGFVYSYDTGTKAFFSKKIDWTYKGTFDVKLFAVKNAEINHNFNEPLILDSEGIYSYIIDNETNGCEITYDPDAMVIQTKNPYSGWKDYDVDVVTGADALDFRIRFTGEGGYAAGVTKAVHILFNDNRNVPVVAAHDGIVIYDPNDPVITEEEILRAVYDSESSSELLPIDSGNFVIQYKPLLSYIAYEPMEAKYFKYGLEVRVYYLGDEEYCNAASAPVQVNVQTDDRTDVVVMIKDSFVLEGTTLEAFYEDPHTVLFENVYDGAFDLSEEVNDVTIAQDEVVIEYLAYEYYESYDLLKTTKKECWRSIDSNVVSETMGDHLFLCDPSGTEKIRFRYLGNDLYRSSESNVCILSAEKVPTEIRFDGDIEVYYDQDEWLCSMDIESAIERGLKIVELGEGNPEIEWELFWDVDLQYDSLKPSILPRTVTVNYLGNEVYASCSKTIKLTILPALAKIKVNNEIINYGGTPGRSVKTLKYHKFLDGGGEFYESTFDYITITAGIDGNAAGFIGIDFPQSVKDSMRIDYEFGQFDLYQLLSDMVPKEGTSLKGFTETVGILLTLASAFVEDLPFDLGTFQTIIDEIEKLQLDESKLKIQIAKPPVETGVYFVTAMTTNPYYTFAMDTGYLVILPNAEDGAGIRFNQELKWYGFMGTAEANNAFEFGGKLYDEEGLVVEDAEVKSFYIGHNEDGKPVTSCEPIKESGKYTEILYVNGQSVMPAIREYVVLTDDYLIMHHAYGDEVFYNDAFCLPIEDAWLSDYSVYDVNTENERWGWVTPYYIDEYGYKVCGFPYTKGEHEVIISYDDNTEYKQAHIVEKYFICNHIGHLGEPVIVTAPTTEEWGLQTQYCDRCHYTVETWLEPLEEPVDPPTPPTPPVDPTPYYPVTPTPKEEPKITVSGETGNVDVKVSISGTKAKIGDIDQKTIESLLGGENPVAVFDLSKLGKTINEAEFTKTTIERIVNALESKGSESGIIIKLSESEVKFDKAALKAILKQMSGSDLVLKIAVIDKISTIQKLALSDMNVTRKYEISLTSDSKPITDFEGGSARISVPYDLSTEDNPTMLSVWYVSADGETEGMSCSHLNDVLTFTVPHFSLYTVVYQECLKDETCPVSSFADLDPDSWYHDGLHFCISNGFFIGTSETTMDPNSKLSKAQLATVFYRMALREGKGFSGNWSFKLDYKDAESIPEYAYEGVAWLSKEGLFKADENGNFDPNSNVSREEFAVYMKKFVELMGFTMEGKTAVNLDVFADVDIVSEDALPAVQWACDYEIVFGDEKNRLNPDEEVSRAEAAAMLARLYRHN